MFPWPKKKKNTYIYTKNQDIDFFSYRIYIIYYSVIALL